MAKERVGRLRVRLAIVLVIAALYILGLIILPDYQLVLAIIALIFLGLGLALSKRLIGASKD